MSRGHRSRGGTNRHFIHVSPLPETEVPPPPPPCAISSLVLLSFNIRHHNNKAKNAYIKESLNFAMHDMVHIIFVVETKRPTSWWDIAKLLSNSTKRFWAMQANTMTLCNAKLRIGKHDIPTLTHKRIKKKFRSVNNVEYEFWFCRDDIKCCISATKKKYMLNQPIVPNTWLMKIWTNISKELLAFEDKEFQLQQMEALSLWRIFLAIVSLSIPGLQVRVPPNPNTHPISRFSKHLRHNQTTPMMITKTSGRTLGSWTSTTLLESLLFHIKDLRRSSTSSQKRTILTMSQLATCHNAHALTLPKHCLVFLEKRRKCTTNAYTMSSAFYTMWITIMTSSFKLQSAPTIGRYWYWYCWIGLQSRKTMHRRLKAKKMSIYIVSVISS